MAESINLRKRLIGKEDIDFDTTGEGVKSPFFTASGERKELAKINASHFPLTSETREKLNASNVDKALSVLSDKVDNFEATDVLTDDLTVTFSAEDDAETIQNTIDLQKKNLNGHTLTFVFPDSLDQMLYTSLVWQDFFNGTVVISGGKDGSRVAIYDHLDINSLFRIYRCQCEVRIEYFYFVHQNSPYAVSVESSSAVILKGCHFSGVKANETYAVNSIAGNAAFIECDFYEDQEIYPPAGGDGAGKVLGEIFAYSGATPPEGAYLLNGQSISHCRELYPKFWEWLEINAGQMTETPVYKAWTMPALAANGTPGGADYAVEASSGTVSGYDAYKSFDGTFGGSKTFACIDNQKTGSLTWYSPVKLKITRLTLQNSSAATVKELPATFEIFGSNDNSSWTSLVTGTLASTATSATQIVDIPESQYGVGTPGYQYLKFEGTNGGGEDLKFPEITLYGEEYLYTSYAGDGNILTLSNEAYEYTLAGTGVCGGFVIDSTMGSVRLPSVVNGTLWGADISNIGQSLAAGLPNITGGFTLSYAAASALTGSFEGSNYTKATSGESWVSNGNRTVNMDASSSNSIYGNSDTVQPPAIRVSWCIQVFNAATELSEQQSAQLASEMQLKAQVDLANVNSNLDFVVETWKDGAGGWYRKYRSGWVDQGGIVPDGSAAAVTVNFWVEMADSKYTPVVTPSSSGSGSATSRVLSAYDRTVTGMTIFLIDTSNEGTSWRVEGYAATE